MKTDRISWMTVWLAAAVLVVGGVERAQHELCQ
jgi:hypothetical protein